MPDVLCWLHVVVLLLLPPGDGRDFIKAFGKMAEALEDAKGKLALVLSKPAGGCCLDGWKCRECQLVLVVEFLHGDARCLCIPSSVLLWLAARLWCVHSAW
jgi:hypothetical protein